MPYTPSWTEKLGICGAPYRRCDDPTKKEVHRYSTNYANNDSRYADVMGIYLTSYSANAVTPHGKGTTTPPAVSIYGPNGVGFASDAFDKSPDCDTCICGFRSCPDARSNHPKEVPEGPASFSLSHGAARGSIELTWTDSNFDGFSEITDYEYKVSYYSPSQKRYILLFNWTSAGMDNFELIQTGFSNTRCQVTMQARNNEGTSTSRSYKYINTR